MIRSSLIVPEAYPWERVRDNRVGLRRCSHCEEEEKCELKRAPHALHLFFEIRIDRQWAGTLLGIGATLLILLRSNGFDDRERKPPILLHGVSWRHLGRQRNRISTMVEMKA